MSQMNRFIQFNNEQINARQMLHYEQLTRALSHAPYLSLTERQVLELRPKEQALSISVFGVIVIGQSCMLGDYRISIC